MDLARFDAAADRMFDWDDVVQVEMMAAGPLRCPISLDSPPLCPQITPCGHVFSFPAIMQHLVHHGGDRLRRAAPCPLCFAPVVARELRLLHTRSIDPPQVLELAVKLPEQKNVGNYKINIALSVCTLGAEKP